MNGLSNFIIHFYRLPHYYRVPRETTRNQKGHGTSVSFCHSFKLLHTHLIERSLDLLLESGNGFGAIDLLCFCLTVNCIRQDKAWCSGDTGCLSIIEILCDTACIFAALIATVELADIQSFDLFSDRGDSLIGEGTDIFTDDIPEEIIVHFPELVLLACTIGCRGSI